MSVRKDKSKRYWIVDISTVNPATGKRRRIVRKNFPTKKVALMEEQKLRILLLNKVESQEVYTIQLLFDLTMMEDKKDKKMSYIYTQQYNFNAHIAPYFQYAMVSQLDYQSLVSYRECLIEKGLSYNTVNKLMVLLKKILDTAVRHQVLENNPCRLIKKLPIKKVEMNYWSLKEFLLFDRSLKLNNELIFQLFFRLAFFTGMRKGEILALTWQDIDFKKSIINVNKSVTKIGGKEYLSSTKTKAGLRQIAINKKLCSCLLEWQCEQNNKLDIDFYLQELSEIRVFEYSPELVLNAGNIRKRFNQILKRNPSLIPIRLHDFRHSHVAMLIDMGTEPYLIKERIGHASITTTYDVYGHLYPSRQKSISEQIDLLIE